MKKVVLEPLARALGVAAVLHKWYYSFIAKTNENNINALWWTIILNYVTQLGGKNYWRKLRSVRVFVSKTVTVIFFGALARKGGRRVKCLFTNERKRRFSLPKMELRKWSKQRPEFRNPWTKWRFCAAEWDSGLLKMIYLFTHFWINVM